MSVELNYLLKDIIKEQKQRITLKTHFFFMTFNFPLNISP